MSMSRERTLGIVLAVGVAALLYALTKSGLLHESVSAAIDPTLLTNAGTVTPDPLTGRPRYDSRVPRTMPANTDSKVPPIDSLGVITSRPYDAKKATCPAGYTLWNDAADGTYWCILQ